MIHKMKDPLTKVTKITQTHEIQGAFKTYVKQIHCMLSEIDHFLNSLELPVLKDTVSWVFYGSSVYSQANSICCDEWTKSSKGTSGTSTISLSAITITIPMLTLVLFIDYNKS